MSAQLNGDGHESGGPVVVVVVVVVEVVEVELVVVVVVVVVVGGDDATPGDTESMVTEPSAPELWEVTARPASTVAGRASVVVEPGMGVHVLPSGDVDAVNVDPERVTDR